MEVAHRLFHADSRHVLGKVAGSGRDLHRELAVVLASRLLRAARQEWYEQGDCWDRLAVHRDNGNTAPPQRRRCVPCSRS
jgi:protein-L-isoaspartate(D-aspartate) O-methyltransferase